MAIPSGDRLHGILVGTAIAFSLLLGLGHFIDATVALTYQEAVVLVFPASLGAAAGVSK